MKKFLAAFLAMVMVLSLCACVAPESVREEQNDHEATENVEVTENDITEATEPEEETVPEETEGKTLSMGETSGLTYENAFIGIGCTLPEGWTFYTDAQIREMNNIAMDVAGDELQALMENATVIYDMMAVDASGMSSVVVNLEKMDAVQMIGTDLNKSLEATIPLVQSSLENMGCTDVVCQVDSVTIDEQEFVCLNATSQIAGMQMLQCTIGIKCNGYLASFSISCFDEATMSMILDSIYVIE